jgi:pectin methylesterase-like acyl-CoA thioesterase
MKLLALRSASALALTVILTACGGGQADQPTMTAMAVQSSSEGQISAAPAPAIQYAPVQASSTMPAPDCAADGCKSPRIIDANAEAYRYDAMRRAALDEAAGNTNT